jgi:hypothetical protein
MTTFTSTLRPVNPSSSPRPARRINPVRCDCRCILPPVYPTDLLAGGMAGIVIINGTEYDLLPLGPTTRDGYRMTNRDNRKVYDVDTESGFPVCDCPDQLTRRGTVEHPWCKHGCCLMQCRREGKL